MKRAFPLFLTAIFLHLGVATSEAQAVKSGGLFGFKKKGSQVSGDLFPDQSSQPQAELISQEIETPRPVARLSEDGESFSQDQAIEAEGIFREGAEPVVQRDKKKGGFVFPFGKKKKSGNDANLIPVPVPPTAPMPGQITANPVPVAAPVAPVARPTPPSAESVEQQITATPVESERKPSSEEPIFEGVEEEEKSGGFSFFSWRDKKKNVNTARTLPADQSMQKTEDGAVIITADPSHLAAQQSNPGSLLIGNESTENDRGGLFSGMTKPKVRRKKNVDYSNFETVMENGEFVEDEDDGFSATSAPAAPVSNGESSGPRMINGVKTYSSWDEVGGRTTSAADKILRQVR